jgi:outer membrane protein OmpA-like peptidoglycan-associated protein
MRFMFAAAALLLATPVFAQESPEAQMSRAESELRDALPETSGVAIERVAPDEVRLRMPSDITFGFNRADVRYEFMPRIRDVARTLRNYPGMSVVIIGHADAIGSDTYNQELSERRARAVGAVLMDHGIVYNRLAARGMGEWEPIASNASEWGRAQNRRVEIRIKADKPY